MELSHRAGNSYRVVGSGGRLGAGLLRAVLAIGNALISATAVAGSFVLRHIPIDVLSGIAGRWGRLVGPLHWRSRIGLENLRHAFPEKTEEERRAILRGMWDNLFRTAVEYAQIDLIFDFDPEQSEPGRVETQRPENYFALRDDGRPGLIFTAHLGNWELLPICGARFGLDAASLYRPPNFRPIALLLERSRRRAMKNMIASRPGAVYELMSILDRGGHVGLLIDQKFTGRQHLEVPFFGRPAKSNPLLAQLARRYECPVHGARVIRLPKGRFRLEITNEIKLPRDEDGFIDVPRATALVNSIVEGWVRERPEQWLWIHRRWAR